MIRFWVIRSLMRCVNSSRGQNSHCRCLCMRGRQVSSFLLDPTVLQTVLASGTSALPAEGTWTAAPPRDSGEGRLLEI